MTAIYFKFTIYYLDKGTVLYRISDIPYRETIAKKEWAFVLQGASRKDIDDESKAESFLGNLKVLYREERIMRNQRSKHEIPVTDFVGFFFKAYEASLRKARELGIVDSAYLDSHVEILRSTPSPKGDMALLMRLTSELMLIAEEYLVEARNNADGTMIPQQDEYALVEIIQEQPTRADRAANERVKEKAPWNSGVGQGYRELTGRPRRPKESVE